MKRWWHNRKTAKRFRILMEYGWCPLCNSSPPAVDCPVCGGSRAYGPDLGAVETARWAHNWAYIQYRWKKF